MAETPIRFGILGCAEIARKVSRAISLAPNAALYAVGSRSLEKATKFAASNNFPESAKIYGSYDAVLDDPDVDAVYVPLPTSLHIKWAVLAAVKKKHILLEKPVALNAGELDKILEACESNGVQFMDSTMWMHNPRTAKMREFLSDPDKFGELKSMHACFTFAADPEFLENDIRVKPELDALGALGDAGWYCLRAILWAADFRLPDTVVALRGTVFNAAGVILSCGASLHWADGGRTATFHCSFLANLTMNVVATGTRGTLHLTDFVIPFEERQAGFTAATRCGFDEFVTGWVPRPTEHVFYTDVGQEVRMVKEFARLVEAVKNGGAAEKWWPMVSQKTQVVLDAVKASIEAGCEPVSVG